MAGSKGLATSGKRWGLSCVVTDEASMGVILGHMKLFGATDIGFDVIGPIRKQRETAGEKDPKAVESGRKGGLARQAKARRGTAGRLPLIEAGEKVLAAISGPEFKSSVITDGLKKEGWTGSSQIHKAITHLIETKRMRRKDRGVYAKLPVVVKQAV